MGFYDLGKTERAQLVQAMRGIMLNELLQGTSTETHGYFSDEDTYIRKNAYIAVGRMWHDGGHLRGRIRSLLAAMAKDPDFKVRQTAINAAGEIGRRDFDPVRPFFDEGLFDAHHSPRNAVIGSIKKMAEVNPGPVLLWARQYLHHPDKEIRREICHGIELRGRKHPQDVLPLLRELENDATARVRNTLVHVLGQIAYKKGCLPIVVEHLKSWTNRALVHAALAEIVDVHWRYRNFSFLSQEEARAYIAQHIQL